MTTPVTSSSKSNHNFLIVGAAFASACIPLPFSGASRDFLNNMVFYRGWKAAPTDHLEQVFA
jgi:hypothetical protein